MASVKSISIETQMQEAYLDYAMSVIVARALPDVRDGLKPVHRRILYAMFDMGLKHNKPHRKSARIVGEVLGKYHPHGDAAVYDAMVRMAQDFSMRYLLVDGQGNFGSIDGDAAAAMRYTEARMHILAEEMLADIGKETVDFVPNFDDSLQEPTVLPTQIPNLLINGAAGIAVGMATNIPPHNLGEICDALIYLLDRYHKADDITVDDLMQFVKGPDFPTGGVVYRYRDDKGNGKADMIRNAYAMGRGRIIMQAVTHVEEMTRNRHRLVVTELPYQVNKARLIERIAELVRGGKIDGIVDLRDESDRQGIRVCIELTRTVDPTVILDRLMKLTPLRGTFGVTMLALVNGEPRTLTLKKSMLLYVDHRREVISRRSQYDLARAQERAHIIAGLLIALDNIDEVISIIRRSREARTARPKLQKRFKLSEAQAQAILDMPLRRLVGMERRQLKAEAAELQKLITHLESLLADPALILTKIKQELVELKKRYGDARRTQIVGDIPSQLQERDLIPDEAALVAVKRNGEIARAAVAGGVTAGWDYWLDSHTRNQLIALTTHGRALWLPVYQISVLSRRSNTASGPGQDKLRLARGENVIAVVTTPATAEQESRALVIATRRGKIKRVALADVLARRGNESVVMGLDKGDAVVGAVPTVSDESQVLLINNAGKVIRFTVEKIRVMGLPASGVVGMRLGAKDEVVSLQAARAGASLVTISERGFAKRTTLDNYPTHGRGRAGVIGVKVAAKTGPLVAALVADDNQAVQLITAKDKRHTVAVADVVQMSRTAMGQPVIDIDSTDKVSLGLTWGTGETAAPKKRRRRSSSSSTSRKRKTTRKKDTSTTRRRKSKT